MERRASTAATLPDELVLEILARVTDVSTLFRCAMACERWRRLIVDDPFFLRDCWPKRAHHQLSSVLGFIATRRIYGGEGILPARHILSPVFVPLPRSPIGFGRSFIGGSSLSVIGGPWVHTVALASRGGLLLVRLFQQQQHQSIVSLAVCDPISGTCDVLPPVICHDSYAINYAILTDTDFCSSGRRRPLPSYSTFFKVTMIIVLDLAHGSYELNTFSSTDPSWSTTKKCRDHVNERPLLYGPCHAADVCHGTPHWLISDNVDYYALGVSAETSHASMTRISMPLNRRYDTNVHGLPQLSITVDGALSLICLHKDGRRLETWTIQDGGAGWLPSPVIELNLPQQRKVNDAPRYVYLAERNGVLLIKDNVQRVYVADLKTVTPLEEVTDSLSGMKYSARVVPFEVDLHAFFLSRLRLGRE